VCTSRRCGDVAEGMAPISRAIDGDVDLFGDVRHSPESTVLAKAAGANGIIRMVIRIKMDRLITERTGPGPTPIERLLARRAAYCWLVLWRHEGRLAAAEDPPLKREESHHRRIDATHRRDLSSLRTLAQVRKLASPVVRIDIGGNQVNVVVI
jgi:hypothetical protein